MHGLTQEQDEAREAGARVALELDTIQSDFAVLDEWEDRYRYVIELGRMLEPLPEAARVDANKVRGCASQVWLVTTMDGGGEGAEPVMRFTGDSDALIVRGLIAILFAIYQGRTPSEALAIDPEVILAGLGLKDHLTPQRSNGLAAMLARIQADARAAQG